MPQDQELIALSEELRQDTAQKTGGLLIRFKDRKGQEFTQKYSKMHGSILGQALETLHLKDTAELQKAWYQYHMTTFRQGFPRYIPVKKA